MRGGGGEYRSFPTTEDWGMLSVKKRKMCEKANVKTEVMKSGLYLSLKREEMKAFERLNGRKKKRRPAIYNLEIEDRRCEDLQNWET